MSDPASPNAQAIAELFNYSTFLGALVFLLVTGLVLYSAYRFRGRPGEGEPRQVHGHRNLEILWTAVPLAIVAFLFVLTVLNFGRADPTLDHAVRVADVQAGLQPDRGGDIVVIGHQFWWEIQYPGSNAITANEIHLPAGRPMLLKLDSPDVIHDLWVPQLGRKMDMIPGQYHYLTWHADRPGVYEGACSEFCGIQHAWMRIRVIAHPPEEFEAWLSRESQPAAPFPPPDLPTPPPQAVVVEEGGPLPPGDPVRGAKLFQQRTCINCHAIRGTTATSRAGPDLTHFASRGVIAAGVLTNTTENLARWISNPQQVKPGNWMPNMLLTRQEVSDLVAYMETLK